MVVAWTAFLLFVGVLTAAVVVLARSSAKLVRTEEFDEIGDDLLRSNVAVTQALVALVLLAGAWLANVPPRAFGWLGLTVPAIALGVGLGVVLSVGNSILDRFVSTPALRRAATLRENLAPDSVGGWFVLLFGVIPTVAISEELLFRGALVGAMAVGFPVSPWLLALVSSLAFGAAHSAQGGVGVVVAGVFGFVLAAVFIHTQNIVVVIVAHAVVDAVEFLVHEGPKTRLQSFE